MKVPFIILLTSIGLCVDYSTEIQPIFNNNCGNCHLGNNSSGDLNLSSYDDLMSSDVIVPGDHEDSELYDRITRPESAPGDMPPNGNLLASEIELIANWIDEGALEFEESSCLLGDVNEDNMLNILDVVSLINIILSLGTSYRAC